MCIDLLIKNLLSLKSGLNASAKCIRAGLPAQSAQSDCRLSKAEGFLQFLSNREFATIVLSCSEF